MCGACETWYIDHVLEDRRAISDAPPLPPGAGPFHIKGGGFLGHLAWVDASYPGGRETFLAALSPDMREYFETMFLASGWYDLLALASAGHVCARTLGMGYREFIAMRSRHQAQLDISGMYRFLLKLASPRMVAARIPKVMAQYLDFGTSRIVREDETSVAFDLVGIPVILTDWLLGAYEGFFDVIVTSAGGKSPVYRSESSVHPKVHGFPAVTLRLDAGWT
jgi:hypothetical protein